MRQSPYFMLTHHGNQALMNCKHGQNTWAKFKFSCEITHYKKISISIFQQFFLLVSTKFIFWEDDGALGYNSRRFS